MFRGPGVRKVVTPFIIFFPGDSAVSELVLHGIPVFKISPETAAGL